MLQQLITFDSISFTQNDENRKHISQQDSWEQVVDFLLFDFFFHKYNPHGIRFSRQRDDSIHGQMN